MSENVDQQAAITARASVLMRDVPVPLDEYLLAYRDLRIILIMDCCLAASVLTFLAALSLLISNGKRNAWFFTGVIVTVLPCLLSDIFYFVVLGEADAGRRAWYMGRIHSNVAVMTMILALSIQRLKVFAHAGLADWLTDSRRRVCLAAVLFLGATCVTMLAESYAQIEFSLLFRDTSKFRRTFVASVLAINALGDCTCSIIVFMTVLRLRGLVLQSQGRHVTVATRQKSSLKATRQLIRANHRVKALVVRIMGAQAGMLVMLTAGIGVFLALPSLCGEVLGAFFERLYVALTMTQWKFVMDLLHDHLVRERVPRLQETSSAPAASVAAAERNAVTPVWSRFSADPREIIRRASLMVKAAGPSKPQAPRGAPLVRGRQGIGSSGLAVFELHSSAQLSASARRSSQSVDQQSSTLQDRAKETTTARIEQEPSR
ncbi:hypothetical protein AMAG_20421 [Allomyces macrogynus ATCC 38327]|uniref:Uncharacterized protein n=1 Tax=Allomyces macrogynus (strain ATCC 38327) TaxID=578462 RepID=A0A0L0TB21_ALLM3|nr:hypothetical protein AMAG_20421 [Allomyces macrogynus ATCC 38327]|eukprot:KNE71968.1 hypothetical protein AMAG_20421 [Allomyces macrogynus ATCC 38327]